jgi:hypothetical protein
MIYLRYQNPNICIFKNLICAFSIEIVQIIVHNNLIINSTQMLNNLIYFKKAKVARQLENVTHIW